MGSLTPGQRRQPENDVRENIGNRLFFSRNKKTKNKKKFKPASPRRGKKPPESHTHPPGQNTWSGASCSPPVGDCKHHRATSKWLGRRDRVPQCRSPKLRPAPVSTVPIGRCNPPTNTSPIDAGGDSATSHTGREEDGLLRACPEVTTLL